jgi:NAD(P)-dependent dehydrogenase (short-subunit alcohol dehydrogenase family)
MRSGPAKATRTIVMTGATRGLGNIAAIKLLQDAPDVHLLVLARSDGAGVADDLRQASGNPHVSSVTADLASLDSMRAAAAVIRETSTGRPYHRWPASSATRDCS